MTAGDLPARVDAACRRLRGDVDGVLAALDQVEEIERQQEEAWRSLPDRLLTDDVCETCGCPRLRTESDLDGETT